jgi:hypothetical protein
MFVDRRDQFPETLCPIIAEPHVSHSSECNSPGWHNHFIRASCSLREYRETLSGVRHGSGFPPSEEFLSREFLSSVAFQQNRLVCGYFANDHSVDF